jgi:hypothetical protein
MDQKEKKGSTYTHIRLNTAKMTQRTDEKIKQFQSRKSNSKVAKTPTRGKSAEKKVGGTINIQSDNDGKNTNVVVSDDDYVRSCTSPSEEMSDKESVNSERQT